MLNIYNYHTDPKSLAVPSDKVAQEWKKERDDELPHFTRELYALQNDYNVQIASDTKQDGTIWFATSWTRRSHSVLKGRLSFLIPPDAFVVHVLDEVGHTVEIIPDPHDMISQFTDELNHDGAFAEEDEYEYEDEYEDEEYDD
jgi:hypothetical protein